MLSLRFAKAVLILFIGGAVEMMGIGREVMRECLGSEGIQDLAQWCLIAFHSWKPEEELVRHSQGSCGFFMLVSMAVIHICTPRHACSVAYLSISQSIKAVA